MSTATATNPTHLLDHPARGLAGDPLQKIVPIGQGLDCAAFETLPDEVLLTDDGFRQGPSAWTGFANPSPTWSMQLASIPIFPSMRDLSKGTPYRGFTIVELLVVVAIIGTLATLGVFGMRTALLASRESVCMGNMRNIGVALHLYAVDHDGRFPETTHTIDLDGAWIYALESYLGNFEETRVCPEDPKRKDRIKAKGTSYVLNSYLVVPEVDPFGEPTGPALNRLAMIPEPSRTLIAFICSDVTGTGPGNDHTHSNRWSSWEAVTRDIAPDRFGGGASDHTRGRSNYLFVDGRVESVPALGVKRKIDAGINIAKPPGIP